MTPVQRLVPVDDAMPKAEAALASLLAQLAERQDRVAEELAEWRKLAPVPAAAAQNLAVALAFKRDAETERDQAVKERDEALTTRHTLTMERDSARAALAYAIRERDGAQAKALDNWNLAMNLARQQSSRANAADAELARVRDGVEVLARKIDRDVASTKESECGVSQDTKDELAHERYMLEPISTALRYLLTTVQPVSVPDELPAQAGRS